MFMAGSLRGIASTLLILGGLWVLFLVSAHLFLDFEQSRRYLSSISHSTPLFGLADYGNDENENGRDSVESQSVCEIPVDRTYPDCENQVQRLRESWTKDPCYKEYDVDGTDCSIIIYLSEVESWCARLPWRRHMGMKRRKSQQAILKNDLDGLESILRKAPAIGQFASRIHSLWVHWKDGYRAMKESQLLDRDRKKILLYVGALDDMATNASIPLTDDLVQWLDLLTSLYVLGHELVVSHDRGELLSYLTEASSAMHRRCKKYDNSFDLVYIDLVGLDHLMTSASEPETRSRIMEKYKCKFRVVDSFGTEAEFNYAKYDKEIPGGRSNLGNWDFNLRQFLTRFPSSPDNSFLGFAVGARLRKRPFLKKKKMVVVFGDDTSFFKQNTAFLAIAKKYMRIHSVLTQKNFKEAINLPSFVINHKSISPHELQELLTKSKSFVGIGSPLESVLPLQALSKGCVFINPKFTPPRNRLNTADLADKPSTRKLTSQQPYLENVVGRPHVITLDLNNASEVEAAIKKIAKTKVRTYIPYEFTTEGMLERVNTYVENQDFCQNSQWPPAVELRVKISAPGDSCTDTCAQNGLVCEPELFHTIESSRIHGCRIKERQESLIAPAKESNSTVCILQKQPLLYSCSSSSENYRRICPCRATKMKRQPLCRHC